MGEIKRATGACGKTLQLGAVRCSTAIGRYANSLQTSYHSRSTTHTLSNEMSITMVGDILQFRNDMTASVVWHVFTNIERTCTLSSHENTFISKSWTIHLCDDAASTAGGSTYAHATFSYLYESGFLAESRSRPSSLQQK